MSRNSRLRPLAALLALTALASTAASAQQPAAAKLPSPEVGTMAPDFTLIGATRYGVLRDSVRLSDYRGKTVVLAFFFKARTKG
jgi:hypothetical protein